jgi:hypothetical protein
MVVHSPIYPPLADEHVIAVDPPFKPDLPGVWRRRINAFTGRAISDKALTAEQALRSGLQRLHGLSMAPGIVDGLVALPDKGAIGADIAPPKPVGDTPPQRAATIMVLPGLGLAASGEDIRFGSARQFRLGDVPMILPVAMADSVRPPAPSPTPASAPKPPSD